jgi:DNA segregation ATPase FtsK/SpoIIIE-like protein
LPHHTPFPLFHCWVNQRGNLQQETSKPMHMLYNGTLMNFGIAVEMDEISIGPTVTRYAMKPAQGVRLSKIASLQNELALALAAKSIRIEAPIPGRSLVGIEVPNSQKSMIGSWNHSGGTRISVFTKTSVGFFGEKRCGNITLCRPCKKCPMP